MSISGHVRKVQDELCRIEGQLREARLANRVCLGHTYSAAKRTRVETPPSRDKPQIIPTSRVTPIGRPVGEVPECIDIIDLSGGSSIENQAIRT